MVQLALWTTIAWLCALAYSQYWHKFIGSKNPEKYGMNSYGAGKTLLFVLWMAFVIFGIGYLSGAMSGGGGHSNVQEPGGESVTKWPSWNLVLPLLLLAIMMYWVLKREIIGAAMTMKNRRFARVFANLACLGFLALIVLQMFKWNQWANNIYMVLLFTLIMAQVAYLFRRSGLLTIFSLIILLDLYLVWVSQNGISSDKGNWYIRMIQSELMRHWPVPIAFRVDGHLIGGGDIFFMSIAIIHARRLFNTAVAIGLGVLMTAPLLVITYLYQVWPNMPKAWPYTIFIAPWAILLVLISMWRDRKAAQKTAAS